MKIKLVLAGVFLATAVGLAAYSLLQPSSTSEVVRSDMSGFLVGEMAELTIVSEPQKITDQIIASADGSPVRLSDMAGKAMLVNLWASWCAPCIEELPSLERLQATLGSDTFEVVALNVDRGGHRMAAEVLAEWNVSGLKVYADPSLQILTKLQAEGLPTSLVVDTDGNVRAYYLGPLEWDAPESIAFFKALSEGRI